MYYCRSIAYLLQWAREYGAFNLGANLSETRAHAALGQVQVRGSRHTVHSARRATSPYLRAQRGKRLAAIRTLAHKKYLSGKRIS